MRYSLIGAGLRVVALARLDRFGARWHGGAGAILTFHHVRPPGTPAFRQNAILEITPVYLDTILAEARRLDYDLIPLDAVPERLADPGSRRFLALTFDDGYRDNRDHAPPVLRRHGAPWALFLTPGFADRAAPMWWLDLEDVVHRLDRIRLELPSGPLSLEMHGRDAKARAFSELYWRLRAAGEAATRKALGELAAEAGLDRAARQAELCMDWAELRALAREPGLTIGAHSITHPRLATLPEAEARAEIRDSRTRLEAELAVPVRHFAYPVGDPTSAGPREFRAVREGGFATGLTTRAGVLFAEHRDHLAALPRISINGLFQSIDFFRALLSGVPTALRNRGRRIDVA